MRVKDDSEKPDSKHNIKKTKIMAPGHITSGWIEGEKVEPVIDFIFLSSKITADGDCSMKLKDDCSWKKTYDKPRQHIKKVETSLSDKDPYSKLRFFQY